MARIITVCRRVPRPADLEANCLVADNMSHIRWFKMSEALARRGHRVEIAVPDAAAAWPHPFGLPQVPLSAVDWRKYDVVKTEFHRGFETLETYGGTDHPFIISKLGSVVAPEDRYGIHFFGEIRESLYRIQERLHRCSHFITVLNGMGRQLLDECHGPRGGILYVPGAADREWPESFPGDPYPDPEDGRIRILFAGLVYFPEHQPEANRVLVAKLNLLARLLSERKATLYMIGQGDLSRLDRRFVRYLGSVPHHETPAYFHYAHAGVVVAAGNWHHNNESSKIYHYLRAGLPVVTESGFPNEFVIGESGMGFVVPAGDIEALADRLVEAAQRDWDRERAVRYILDHHTWDQRASVYDSILGGVA